MKALHAPNISKITQSLQSNTVVLKKHQKMEKRGNHMLKLSEPLCNIKPNKKKIKKLMINQNRK